jgi:AcrR family transcriptional regulator
MGHKHSRDEILDAAVAVAHDEGLNRLTYGRVAARIGIADRTVVYYFPTKTDLVSAALAAIGLRLQAKLAQAFSARAADHRELARAAWPVLAHPDADAVFALFFEATGLAAAGERPYTTVVPTLFQAWIDWVATFIGAPADRVKPEATATIALLDGLLLLRQVSGPEVADRAARTLGIAREDTQSGVAPR